MSTLLANLPLFPLGTVLFPSGLLPLRVFEARYLDMARTCLRNNTPFGVCLLKSGSEVNHPGHAAPPVPETVGCLADIVSCDMEQLGVLLLRCRGSARFRLRASHVEADGLLRGVAERFEEDTLTDTPEHRMRLASCAEVLSRIIDNLDEHKPPHSPFLAPYLLADATWVGNRLAEVLPISMRAKQQLMELDDAGVRLELVHQYMSRHQML